MKIRLMGTSEDIEKAIEHLEKEFNIYEVSKLYKNRGISEYYRCYVECEPLTEHIIPDNKLKEFLALVGRAEMDSDGMFDSKTAYLKAIRATLMAIGYDEEWANTKLKEKLESYFEGV